ncbi:unnamed protein product [Ambrosiozyma monospora]|uniref:Unnamed protein product n=1 Tax=Ambrosiozyma monospora TaxID=43982 RepID=A0A9W7DHM6_AMBMO|nr:unnamed protein product [Ambrosiozyma monospora]
MTSLIPAYINIRRGGYICALVGFLICVDYDFLSSSSKFTTYLSAYSVFLSAIAGVVFCDYFILRKGYIILRELYVANNTSSYFYAKGFNPRAYTAYICGILPNIVGFVGATGTHHVPNGATKLYFFSFFTGYISSACVLLILSLIFPVRGLMQENLLAIDNWYEEWQDVEDFDALVHRHVPVAHSEAGSV